ncbi:MurR/RpiR family transcriptional regulator [Cryobacterium sp. N21]|uniref:MurR/RpiR family transcriptional regulator n=1 Tax=Cryobacterium sp. N21 TaxID=2048289 RepID=UPI000CE41AFB|nr:MurR/RpiR family transcriptional regulator [Cryobacterium sp. N21]
MTDPLTLWLDDLEPAGGHTPSHRRVAEVVLKNQQLASYSEIAEISERAGVNPSTVVRFAQALGFKGWPELQQELRVRYLATLTSEETLRAHPSSTLPSAVHDAIHQDIANLQQTIDSIEITDSEAAIEALASAGRILVVGMGSFSAPASVLAHLGSVMGYPISFEGRGGPHLATAMTTLTADDVLVVCNVWRPIRDVLAAAEAAKHTGTTVIAITDMRRGKLAAAADLPLIVPSEGVSFLQSATAATSVVYGLLSGMEAARPERSRAALRRTQELWQQLGTFND